MHLGAICFQILPHSVSLHGSNTKATRRLCDTRVPRIKILKVYMPLERGPRAPGSPRNQDSTPTAGSHFHGLSHTVRMKPAVFSECPHRSPCSSIWKEPQCVHNLVSHAVYLAVLAWAPKHGRVCPFGCFGLRFLSALSVSLYGNRVCVDVIGVLGSSVFEGERILGEAPRHRCDAPPCWHLLQRALTCVALWVCAKACAHVCGCPQSGRAHTSAPASPPPHSMSTSFWQEGWVLSHLTGELASAFLSRELLMLTSSFSRILPCAPEP